MTPSMSHKLKKNVQVHTWLAYFTFLVFDVTVNQKKHSEHNEYNQEKSNGVIFISCACSYFFFLCLPVPPVDEKEEDMNAKREHPPPPL